MNGNDNIQSGKMDEKPVMKTASAAQITVVLRKPSCKAYRRSSQCRLRPSKRNQREPADQ